MQLTGKKAMVTGGGRGIGHAISLALAAAGAHVCLTWQKDESSAHNTLYEISTKGGSGETVRLEVTDRKSVRAAMVSAAGEKAQLDILVNNAGINMPANFDQVTEEEWDRVLAVNLKGPFLACQEALTFMKRQGGAIINIGSVSGQYGGPRTAHYAAAKAGLISLGQVVARFGAPFNIRCNTVAAGLIQSEMAESGLASPAVREAAKKILLGRLGTPEEVARSVVFLASDHASYITAQTLNVNGGLYF